MRGGVEWASRGDELEVEALELDAVYDVKSLGPGAAFVAKWSARPGPSTDSGPFAILKGALR